MRLGSTGGNWAGVFACAGSRRLTAKPPTVASDDYEAYYADLDRRARERRERRSARRRRRAPRELRHLAESRAGRLLIGLVAAIAAATAVGLVALWPHGPVGHRPPGVTDTIPAEVERVADVACEGPTAQRCRQATIRVDGRPARLTLGPVALAPELDAGDTVRVTEVPEIEGVPAPAEAEPYTFVDVDRHGSILLMGLAAAVIGVLVLRLRGLLAAVGVALSLVVVLAFLVPAILAGRPALLVALVGSLAVMFVTVTLTNGIGAQTMAAVLGIAATLLLACGLASLGVSLADLDGRADELTLALGQQNGAVSLTGVVLAGMIVGALGVLADTAVTQASAVMALRRAGPALGARALYREAFVVGRDHLSATIHTLVLAYAGAALPLLLLMVNSRVATVDALNAQSIAEPAVAAIVGCVALIAAVPLATGLAAALVAHVPPAALPAVHAHDH